MQLLAPLLGFGSVLIAVIALVALVRPISRIGLKTRKHALGALVFSFVGFVTAGILTPVEDHEGPAETPPVADREKREKNQEVSAQTEKDVDSIDDAARNTVTGDENQQPSPDSNTSASKSEVEKFLVHEFHIVENKDTSVARRKRNMVKIFSPRATTPEALIATAMEAAMQMQRSEWSQFLKVFVVASHSPDSDSLAQVSFAPDGCGVSGDDCTGEMWIDAKAVSEVPTRRQIEIVEAERKHEASFREVVSWKIDSSGFDIVTEKVEPLYNQLMQFKNEENFKIVGFGVRGPYNQWLVNVKKFRDEADERQLFAKWNISFSDLIVLGFEYLDSGGKETEETRAHMERFSLAFSSKPGERQEYEVNKEKLKTFLAEKFQTTTSEIENEHKAYWAAMFSKEDVNLPDQLKSNGAISEDDMKEQTCRLDLQCWGDKKALEAIFACEDLIENLARYTHEWTDGILEPKFSKFRWENRSEGVVTYMGDKIQFQNGFGAWMPHRYRCDYDTLKKRVLNVEAEPGRM